MPTRDREVVAITGASGGVGRATARAFAKRGARIGLIARGKAGLEAAQREVEELGSEAIVLPTDVADQDQVEEAASRLESEFGPIDTWINCAMVTVMAPIYETTGEEFKRVTEVNYLGYVYGTKAALDRMLPRDQGTIVQVSSALAFRAIPLQAAYCATKHAVKGFTESLRTELLHDGSNVHITMVHMPALNTPQFDWSRTKLPNKPQPVPPIYQPEVAADAIVWSADHKRREITVGRSSVQAIYGNRVAPGLGDRYLARNAYESQQTDQPVDPDRPDILWEPADRDFGAHGSFDDRAVDSSWQLEANKHRGMVALGAAALAGVAFAVMNQNHHRDESSWWRQLLRGKTF
jgi:short-subunit dehydrogenase